MKREDEEFCKAQLDTFIKQFLVSSQVTWEEVAQQDEPPDYYLLLNKIEYAVEVTTLIELVSVGTSSQLPHFVIRRFFEQFTDEVEEIAKAKGYLRGNYLVVFPTPIDDFAAVRDRIQDKLLKYIRNTSSLEKTSFEKVFERIVPQQPPQQCEIRKLGNKPNRVKGGGPVLSKWEGEAAKKLCDLLNDSLNAKAGKLKDVGKPIILLLLDEYPFANQQMYQDCAQHLSSLDHFHTVFIVQAHGGGFSLYSQNRDWLRQ